MINHDIGNGNLLEQYGITGLTTIILTSNTQLIKDIFGMGIKANYHWILLTITEIQS